MRQGLALLSTLVLSACSSRASDRTIPVAAAARALDARTVEVTFTETVDPDSVSIEQMGARAAFARPMLTLGVEAVRVEGSLVTVTTEAQRGGVLYTLSLGALRFERLDRTDAPRQVSFRGFGLAPVRIELDSTGFIAPPVLEARISLDPSSGSYTDTLQPVALLPDDKPGLFSATVSARIDPSADYAVRAVTLEGREAGRLTRFSVTSTAGAVVNLAPQLPRVPEFEAPIDPTPGDGFAPVRIVIDDRLARELARPELRSSIDANGRFDASITRLDRFAPVRDKPRVYETTINVAVDPARSLEGTTPETFPYVIFLVENGEDAPQRGANFAMPTETPQVIVIPNGNPELVPVRFRIDVKSAILEPDGRARGKYPGEGIFLTGEFPSAEDALGRLAADAFTGGERSTLEMHERPDAPGIFEKTVFMMPNRPYGWKVVRCPSGQGCAELNRHVVSSGRAFPTVMKNLVTANVDAAQSRAVRLIDPAALDHVELEGGRVADYSRARVSETGDEMPGEGVMFKQEAPDLVVTVGTTPVTTPTYVVGTWRDVNIPMTPAEIIAEAATLDLNPYDYDDGLQGRFPLTRDVALPEDPGGAMPPTPANDGPPFAPRDGRVDVSARRVSAEPGHPPLFVGYNGRELYVATEPARSGRDHFIVVSLDAPEGAAPAPWTKRGTVAASRRQLFLAMEGDGDFAGWFRRSNTGADTLIEDASVASSKGEALEGAIDLSRANLGPLGAKVWVTVIAYETANGGALVAGAQSPPGNGDAQVDPAEMLEVELSSLASN